MSSTKNKIVLKKLKELDTIWHPESTLVFKSSKDKVVIGRYENQELISLDDECLDLCAKWKFKYDKDLVQEDEEEEEKEEKEDEEKDDDYEKVEENIKNEEQVEHKEKVEDKEKVEEVKADEEDDEEVKAEEDDEEVKADDEEDDEEVKADDEEDDEEVKADEEDEIVTPSINISIKEGVADITNYYTKKIHHFFDNLSQKYNEDILNLNNEIIQKNKLYDELLSKYNKEYSEHTNTQEELKKLKTKFDGIKQLFSL